MATMREEIDKYKGQVKAYPAGAPNTAVVPQDDGKFRPAENVAMNPAPDRVSSAVGGAVRGISKVGESMAGTSGGVAMRGPEIRGNVPTRGQLQDKPFSYQQQPGMGQIARGVLDAMAKTSGAISIPGAEGQAVSSLRAPANGPVMPTQREQLLQSPEGFVPGDQKTVWPGVADAASRFAEGVSVRAANAGEIGVPMAPDKVSVANDVAVPTTTPQAFTPAASVMADSEPSRPTMTPEQIRATILEKNGFARANVPITANPGLTLSAKPATPRTPLPYNGRFAQPDPQEALQRKQMEVMNAERADKTLIYGPGSRDYISPTLTEDQQRVRQGEIAVQRKQDMEDVVAGNVARATVNATNDMATGRTSERNLAMLPYAERRTAINTRNGLMENSANLEKDRKVMATADADRTSKEDTEAMKDSTTRRGQDIEVDVQGQKLGSEERRALMTDSTTRRGQDVDADTNRTNAEIQAESKARDRAVTLEAARIKAAADAKDPVAVQMQKGRDAAIAAVLGSMTPEKAQDPVWLEWLDKTYPIGGAQSGRVDPAADGNFPTR